MVSSFVGRPMSTDSSDGFFISDYLTDEQIATECVACWCDRCGQKLFMHILYPRIGRKSLEHGCVAKPPVLWEVVLQEVKPMEMPSSKLLEMDYRYKEIK